MAKPTDTVPPWATAGNYPPSVYGALVPEMIPNPQAGLATPWSNLPRTEAGTLAAFATQGLSPQIPTAAQEYNEWLQRVGLWVNWVEAGTSADDADAHIVETNSAGLISAQAAELTQGAFGAGSTQLPLPHGAVIPDTKTLTLEDGSDIALQGDASIDGPGTTSVTTGTVAANSVVYDDMGITLDVDRGATRWNKTSLLLGDGAHGRAVSVPDRGFDATFTTINAIDDTTADCIREKLDEDEPVWITITARFECDNAPETLNTRLKIIGPATIDVDIDDYRIDVANVGDPYSRTFRWVPTDDFVLPGTVSYTFRARFGVTGGANLLMTNISIKCEGALRAP